MPRPPYKSVALDDHPVRIDFEFRRLCQILADRYETAYGVFGAKSGMMYVEPWSPKRKYLWTTLNAAQRKRSKAK